MVAEGIREGKLEAGGVEQSSRENSPDSSCCSDLPGPCLQLCLGLQLCPMLVREIACLFSPILCVYFPWSHAIPHPGLSPLGSQIHDSHLCAFFSCRLVAVYLVPPSCHHRNLPFQCLQQSLHNSLHQLHRQSNPPHPGHPLPRKRHNRRLHPLAAIGNRSHRRLCHPHSLLPQQVPPNGIVQILLLGCKYKLYFSVGDFGDGSAWRSPSSWSYYHLHFFLPSML